MSGDFKCVNGALFVLPMEDIIIEEFVGFGSEVNSIASEFVSNLSKLMPVGCLPLSRSVLFRKESNIDVFGGEFELIHEDVGIRGLDGLGLTSVETNK